MKWKTSFLVEYALNVDAVRESVTIDDLLGAAAVKREQPWYDDVRHVLLDFRRAQFAFDVKEVSDLAQTHTASEDSLFSKPACLLVDAPIQTALSMLYGVRTVGKRLVTTASTVEQAAVFVDCPFVVLAAELERLHRQLDEEADGRS